jgi:hypothetical protein
MTARLRVPFVLAQTPTGTHQIFEVEEGTIEGERIRGKTKGSANADWLRVGPDGTGTLDVRALIETDDGALIFIHYSGRVDASKNGRAPVYAAPLFETGDDRYRWLNLVQAIGKGSFDGTTLTYDLYEVR